jgi:hypothetical protein
MYIAVTYKERRVDFKDEICVCVFGEVADGKPDNGAMQLKGPSRTHFPNI